ncbi:hypothetical protein EQV77_04370 [Halobacillus fulvus]|nr:hypothetical protein EQV77_04370 [Halobacillus fulvus]
MYRSYPNRPSFPPVNPDTFMQSAGETDRLLTDAKKLLERVQSSESYATQIMNAAQESKKEEVKQLVKASGIESQIDVLFTPSSLKLDLISSQGSRIELVMRW